MAAFIKIKYHRRLFLALLVYSWLLLGCFAAYQYYREYRFKAIELDMQLQMVNTAIINEIADEGRDAIKSLPAIVKASPFSDLRITVIDTTGRVVYDNSLDRLPDVSHLDRKEINDALAYGSGYSLRRHSATTGATYFYSARRGNGIVVRTAVPYTVTLIEFMSVDYGFLWYMVGVTAVMCVIGFFVTRRLGQNVARLNRFAETAERGETVFDDEPFPHDELGEISHHIVRLYAGMQKVVAERDRGHREALHQEQEKIRIKRTLTNNINHELKTPVAAMRVCLETLLAHPEMSEERREEFIRRSLAANERLQRLMADVSTITRIEDGGDAIAREQVDLAAIIIDTVEECLPMAQDKGMEIECDIQRPLLINGNQSLVESVFRNLIDNAIAYSGGSTVTIDSHPGITPNTVVITVADDGTGVPAEHLPRLFERFYRLDKGRSRRAGGTGLGLSIVKNAVLWHGGSISVANAKDGGLRFTITLPILPPKGA